MPAPQFGTRAGTRPALPRPGASPGGAQPDVLGGLADLLGNAPRQPDRNPLEEFFNRDRRSNADEEYAKACRDAAIANAVVGLIGIILEHSDRQRGYASAPGPAGHIEQRGVVVEPERRIEERVWIPPVYDPVNGRELRSGYYETRVRVTPPVIEYRDVFVPSP